MKEEYAVMFENGAWLVMLRPSEFTNHPWQMLEPCPTFETAIHAIAIRVNGPVLIRTITGY
jgi:hypothetical protein